MKTYQKIQVRWLLPERMRFLFDTMPHKKVRIEDGFLGTNLELRVRVSDEVLVPGNQSADLTYTWAGDKVRLSGVPTPVSTEAAYIALQATKFKTNKYRRILQDGWKIDEYFGPLDRFLIAEFDPESATSRIPLPAWLQDAIDAGDTVEVTDAITSRHLAWLSANAKQDQPLPLDAALARPLRVAITGSACSGKSSLIKVLRGEIGHVAHFLPEIVTMINAQAGVKPPMHDARLMREFQHGVYRLQRGFEDVSTLQTVCDGKGILFTDRGTVDSAAFLHGGVDELCELTGLSLAEHNARYDAVFILGMAPREVYEREKHNNDARTETYEQSQAQDGRIRHVWSSHPRKFEIDGDTWAGKVECARQAIRTILPREYA